MRDDLLRTIVASLVVILIVLFVVPFILSLLMGWQIPMPGMMGMMGGFPMFIMALPIWALIIILILFLVGILQSGKREERIVIGGADYREASPKEDIESGEADEPEIFKVLKPDERRVVEILMANGGVMLQKDLRWELGLNRVQIHRILERLEERNIIVRRSVGNTNEVRLTDWFMEKYVKR